MHVLVYSSKNQENSKITNINVYLSNANSSKYMTEWTNQEKELRSKTTNAAAGEVMLTVETSRGGERPPPPMVTKLHITAQKQDICTTISSGGLSKLRRLEPPGCTMSSIRGRAVWGCQIKHKVHLEQNIAYLLLYKVQPGNSCQ